MGRKTGEGGVSRNMYRGWVNYKTQQRESASDEKRGKKKLDKDYKYVQTTVKMEHRDDRSNLSVRK